MASTLGTVSFYLTQKGKTVELTTIVAVVFILALGYYLSTRGLGDHEQPANVSSSSDEMQKVVSLKNFKYINDNLLYKIWIAEKKIELLSLPQMYRLENGKQITADQVFYDENKEYREEFEGKIYGYSRDSHSATMKSISLVSKAELRQAIERDLRSLEIDLKKHDARHMSDLEQYTGYTPEPVVDLKDKYNLDKGFSPLIDNDYLDISASSHWGVYQKRKAKLTGLEKALSSLQGRVAAGGRHAHQP